MIIVPQRGEDVYDHPRMSPGGARAHYIPRATGAVGGKYMIAYSKSGGARVVVDRVGYLVETEAYIDARTTIRIDYRILGGGVAVATRPLNAWEISDLLDRPEEETEYVDRDEVDEALRLLRERSDAPGVGLPTARQLHELRERRKPHAPYPCMWEIEPDPEPQGRRWVRDMRRRDWKEGERYLFQPAFSMGIGWKWCCAETRTMQLQDGRVVSW